MKTATRVELGLIVLATALAGAAAGAGWLPATLRAGVLCLVVSALLLAQGLVRDLWTLRRRRGGSDGAPAMLCMCVESSAGIAGILAGAVLLGVGLGGPVPLPPAVWTALTAVVLLTGLAIRDLVIRTRPLAIVRVPDHGAIRVSLGGSP